MTSHVDLARPEGLLAALRSLVSEGIVQEYSGGLEPVFAIADDRQHEAGFYRNTLVHWFVNRAILEVALLRTADLGASDVDTTTWEGALALRDLLKYEFFFPTKSAFAVQLREETELAVPGWQQAKLSADDVEAALRSSGLILAHRTIGPDEVVVLDLWAKLATLAEGAQGALCDSVFEYGVRDALLYTIGGGTNEIQRTLIALRGLDLPR